MANNYKNCHYKSAIQFQSTALQNILATTLVTNPLALTFGDKVTDTGVAIELGNTSAEIETSGLYRISANIGFDGVTAGVITFAFTLNGQVMPETIRTIDAVAGVAEVIPIETIRALHTCCGIEDYTIGVIAYSDGTGVGNVVRLSGNVVKLA